MIGRTEISTDRNYLIERKVYHSGNVPTPYQNEGNKEPLRAKRIMAREYQKPVHMHMRKNMISRKKRGTANNAATAQKDMDGQER